jgi:hypothetical protein
VRRGGCKILFSESWQWWRLDCFDGEGESTVVCKRLVDLEDHAMTEEKHGTAAKTFKEYIGKISPLTNAIVPS